MSESEITIYFSSISSSQEIKKQQAHIFNILDGMKVNFQKVDVALDDNLTKMRDLLGNPKALAPQMFRGTTPLGDFAAFEDAVENKDLNTFFQITE